MARKTVLLDDYDGTELPDETKPLRVVIGDAAYDVYLSEENSAKFEEAVEPFINTAERVSQSSNRTQTVRAAASGSKAADRERNRKAREWARSTGFEYPGADGKMRTLGERGRVPEEVIKAWEEAGEPA